MRQKLLGIDLTTPIAISSFASTETLSFTPDNINADISLGTLSGKTKEACLSSRRRRPKSQST